MRRPSLLRGFLLAAAALLPAACEPARDPTRPLTADEGAQLLRDVRSDRARLNDLTPAERAYLMKTLRR